MPDHGDFDYQGHGGSYAAVRRADHRIAARIHAALGPARTVLNVGAGTGSYEPEDRHVIALEPSPEMRARRPGHLPPAIAASSAAIPMDDGSVDAAMTVLSVHHWTGLEQGLAEMRRVTRGPVVVLTFDPELLRGWWLQEFCPQVLDVEARRYPPLSRIASALGGTVRVEPVPVAHDCTDGFSEAFFARPDAFLDPQVLRAQSAWGFVSEAVRDSFQQRLRASLAFGDWDRQHGHWRTQREYTGAIRLLVATPA